MKKLNKVEIKERGEIKHTMDEKGVMASVNSPFIAKLHYSFQTPSHLYFVMDYLPGGELFKWLQKELFSETRAKFYAASLTLALECLHAAGIIYRDLKPENVMLKADGNIILIDFGQAKTGLTAEDARTQTMCGTPAYFAPEILNGTPYTKNVDWWSLGTMVYEMLYGTGPFWDDDPPTFYENLLNMELIWDPSWSPEVCDLMSKLIERDGSKRLGTAAEIKKHPWFAGIDWNKLLKLELTPPFVPPSSEEEGQFEDEPDAPGPAPTADSKDFVNFTYIG